jgi:hypothetical protein
MFSKCHPSLQFCLSQQFNSQNPRDLPPTNKAKSELKIRFAEQKRKKKKKIEVSDDSLISFREKCLNNSPNSSSESNAST